MARKYAVSFERNVEIPLRDGVVLRADLYKPAGPGPFPVLLQRTPYDKSGSLGTSAPFAHRAAGEGYAVVIQDTRGRWASDGHFYPFIFEREDGYDTCHWIVDQPWSNGRIGMFGQSYVGATQWQAAVGQSPGLQAIVPGVTAADYHDGWTYQGGAFELNFNQTWMFSALGLAEAVRRKSADASTTPGFESFLDRIDTMDEQWSRLPLTNDAALHDLAPYYNDWLDHPAHDEYWDRIKIAGHYGELEVASLNVGAWYDIFLGGTIQNYRGMKQGASTTGARDATRLLIGPWEHMTPVTFTPTGDWHPGIRSTHGMIDFEGIHLRWYDRFLRDIDNGIDAEPPVTLFVMGENAWRQEPEWPLPNTTYTDYFLASDGGANSLSGSGTLQQDQATGALARPDHYLYEPLDPVPTCGGALCCHLWWAHAGVFDQRAVESRQDVLVYTSAAVEAPVEVTGPVRVFLYAASSAVDTDFTAKLVDVCPCGEARNLTDGIIRARYRKSMQEEHLLEHGEIVEYEIDLWATSNLFLPGHRIRVEVSSSNFPRFDRNPNHGSVIATATHDDCQVAHQTIFHDVDHPSRIILPVVRGELP